MQKRVAVGLTLLAASVIGGVLWALAARNMSADAETVLIVEVVSEENRFPQERVRVELRKDGPSTEIEAARTLNGQRGALGESLITGTGGEVRFIVPANIDFVLSGHGDAGRAGAFQRDVAGLFPREHRRVVIELAVTKDLEFHGRVVSLGNHLPIAGACVLVFSGLATMYTGSPLDDDVVSENWRLAESKTGSDGRFKLSLSSWENPYLRVEAEEFGPAIVSVNAEHQTQETESIISMESGATLIAHVVDSEGRSIAEATVQLQASADDVAHGVMESGPDHFFDLASLCWRGTTDSTGWCTVGSLPAGVPIRVRVFTAGPLPQATSHPTPEGRLKLRRRVAEPVTLLPGELRRVEWELDD
jgi:hypothetical protein